ncbi:SUMF1/EgtB/PvdO family nonheme iron enzyme [Stenotrophomonas sp. MMGLT7]|uniref:formylglycine-generating enzyme family protein n=1 Tax=Stenotrophomonas sp. MMGLT7 TaxID=2901227 RepID=UPI001E533D0B|nr:SUMF1/EgtB/PvdO family nonheme iron enzyme [Stenotrophomonas sp. MMGLT7]MCD7100413.1 formylglycine-generating enzyme family protein [Stenotrophomonas sp. MMGLT7]
MENSPRRHRPAALFLLALHPLLALAQTDTQVSGERRGLSAEEFAEGVKRLQAQFERDAEKARKGECKGMLSPAGNPMTPQCQIILDEDFVAKAVSTRSPTSQIWRRMNELQLVHHETIGSVIRRALANLPSPDNNYVIEAAKQGLAPVGGGTFVMGDYGWLQADPWPITSDRSDDNPFKVKLSDFMIQRHRVTYAEFDAYTRSKGLPLIDIETKGLSFLRYPDYTVRVTWAQAHDYCAWLGEVTGKPFALPTEAQWEYSARSGGRDFAWGIEEADAKKIDPSAFENQLGEIAGDKSGPDPLSNRPAGLYGPNPAGLMDFIGYGTEWVNDWYAAYRTSPEQQPVLDPAGPKQGTEHVTRRSADGTGFTITRRGMGDGYALDDEGKRLAGEETGAAFRCALNSSKW